MRRFPCGLWMALAAAGCVEVEGPEAAEVEARQVDGVWVFAYAEEPESGMDALAGGTAAVVDGCLLVGEAVVVWRAHQLDTVTEVVGRVADGESLELLVGGGGLSTEEGDSLDDFPAAVTEHCTPTELWYSSGETFEVD